MVTKKSFFENHALKARFFMKKNALQARLVKKDAPLATFLIKSTWVVCPIDIVCNLFSTSHSKNLHLFIYSLNND